MCDTGSICNEDSVFIRCQRHRKRIEVPSSWVQQCSFLCPKCYNKLTEEERLKYAPRAILDEIKAKKEKEREIHKKSVITKKRARRKKEKEVFTGFKSSMFNYLLPRYTVHCKKCGGDAPCNLTWFETSTVLCPTCYNSMSEKERALFEGNKTSEKKCSKEVEHDEKMNKYLKSVQCTQTGRIKNISKAESDAMSASGGIWSYESLSRASVAEIMHGIETGKVSKVRARIELKRRKNLDYYNMLPNSDGIRVFYH